MNKRQLMIIGRLGFLLLPILILFLSTFASFAEDESFTVDLDNDGETELITVEQKFATVFSDRSPLPTKGVITVFKQDGTEAGRFFMPNQMGEVEFISLNKDETQQIVAWSTGGTRYTNIDIYRYQSGKLDNIFNNGGACPIEADFQAEQPMIKVGRTNREKEEGSEERAEYLWQVYLWDGEKFIYNEELSTTPEISETEEIQRYIR